MELSGLGVPILVALSFALSVIGLYVFIVALSHNLLWPQTRGRVSSFPPGERTLPKTAASREEVAGLRAAMQGREARGSELADRIAADRSSALAAFIFLMLGVVWLVIGSLAGLTASLKLHMPDWLAAYAPLTFGRHPRGSSEHGRLTVGINDRDGDRSVAPATDAAHRTGGFVLRHRRLPRSGTRACCSG